MLRIAVLGTGKIARTRFLPAARQVSDICVTAIGTRDPDAFDRAIYDLPATTLVGRYEDVVDRRHADAVYIALPNNLHVPWVKRAAAEGLHVLCEKPMAWSLAAALDCRDACERGGVILAEGFMYRHDPRHQDVVHRLRAGAIGEPRMIQAGFAYLLEDPRNIRLSPEAMGGALMDVGCYGIDAARMLMGQEPASISAGGVRGRRSGVDEVAAVVMTFADGAVAAVSVSTHAYRDHWYRIHGTEGIIEVPDAFVPRSDQPTLAMITDRGGRVTTFDYPPRDAFVCEIAAFSRSALAGDVRLWSPGEDGVANAGLLSACADAMANSPIHTFF